MHFNKDLIIVFVPWQWTVLKISYFVALTMSYKQLLVVDSHVHLWQTRLGPHVPNHYLSVTSMTFKSKVLVFSIFHYLYHRNLVFLLYCKSVLKLISLSTRILFVIVTILANSLVDSCTSSKFSLFKSFKSKYPPDFHHDQRKRT